jgi:hypothetical protein
MQRRQGRNNSDSEVQNTATARSKSSVAARPIQNYAATAHRLRIFAGRGSAYHHPFLWLKEFVNLKEEIQCICTLTLTVLLQLILIRVYPLSKGA